ncbi:MAG: response regulator [Desulfomonile tiedjei]|nr:response regulator [Desulfomonile tiedjei]
MSGNSENNKIKVLVVDDSALMSRQIAAILNEDNQIEVVGQAKDGIEAMRMVETLKPDVITLDVEMPKMSGITALKHIMVKHGVPTVMISALTKEGARTTFDALRYGAIDVIAKPSRRDDESLDKQKADIIAKVRRAAAIRTGRSKYIRVSAPPPLRKTSPVGVDSSWPFIGVGAGTGGYYSLLRIVPALQADFRGTLVAVVLVPARYIEPFVSYLDSHSVVRVKGVKEVTVPEPGVCYVCSGESGVVLERNGDGTTALMPGRHAAPPNNGPIDGMLTSLAAMGERAIGIVMTGAGRDGAEGIAEIRSAGGTGVVQDINNAMDPSMPLAVLEKGAVEKILPDYLMAEFIMKIGTSETVS